MLNWDHAPKHSSFKAEVTIIDGDEPIRSGFFMAVAVLKPDALFGSTVNWPIELSNYSKIDDVSVDQNLSIADAQKLIVALQEAIVLGGGPPPASPKIDVPKGWKVEITITGTIIYAPEGHMACMFSPVDVEFINTSLRGAVHRYGQQTNAQDAKICPSLGMIASEQPQFADMPVCSGQPFILPVNVESSQSLTVEVECGRCGTSYRVAQTDSLTTCPNCRNAIRKESTDRGDLPGAEEYHDA